MKSHEQVPFRKFQDGEAIDLAFNKKRADDRKALDKSRWDVDFWRI